MAERVWLFVGLFFLLVASAGTVVVLGPASVRPPTSATPSPFLASLAARVPPGEVATSVRLEPAASVGGALRSGDVIDLLAYFPEQGTGGASATRLLLREAFVYAATRGAGPQTLTLAMPSSQAVLLQQALDSGARPVAVLRPAGNLSPPSPAVFTDTDLLSRLPRLPAGR